jgi:phage terminase large subunit
MKPESQAEILEPDMDPRHKPGAGFDTNSWAQERFHWSQAPELLYSGHRGSSKSRTICEKADWLCRTIPGARIVLSRKKREHMGKTTLVTLLTETITPAHKQWGWNPSADGGSTLYYPNGSEILCAGLDNPGRMLSGEFMANFTDQAEELDEEEFVAIGGSLRQRTDRLGNRIPFQQLGLACNPGGTGHFLYRRFRPDRCAHGSSYVQRSEKETRLLNGKAFPAGRVLRECIVAGLADNMENLPPAYQLWLESLTGRYRERFVLGKWVAFEGSLFDHFDERFHVIDRPASWAEWGGYPPPTWKRVRSVDFGYTAPFVWQWWAISPEKRWYLYREIYRSQRMVADHAKVGKAQEARELAALNAALEAQDKDKWPRRPMLPRLSFSGSYADHADAEARAQLENLGFSTDPAVKDREAGYQTLYEAMAPRLNPVTNATTARCYFIRDARCEAPDPHLVHSGKPTCTHEEIPLLQFLPEPTTPTQPEKEGNIKRNDHGYDAARYALHSHLMGGSGDLTLLK